MGKKKAKKETTSQRFARLLLEEAERRGVSQNELSKRSGVPRSTMYRLMTGERTASLETAGRLAAALGVELREVI